MKISTVVAFHRIVKIISKKLISIISLEKSLENFPGASEFCKSKEKAKKGIYLFLRRYINIFEIPTRQIASKSEYICWNPHQQLKSKSRFWSFSTMKYFKLNWCNIECLVAIDIKSNELKILDLKYNQFVCPWYVSNSLQFMK